MNPTLYGAGGAGGAAGGAATFFSWGVGGSAAGGFAPAAIPFKEFKSLPQSGNPIGASQPPQNDQLKISSNNFFNFKIL
jgi:hypothetical protein